MVLWTKMLAIEANACVTPSHTELYGVNDRYINVCHEILHAISTCHSCHLDVMYSEDKYVHYTSFVHILHTLLKHDTAL